MEKEILKRIEQIEINLIEQEHRPIQVISNFLLRKKKWTKNDNLRTAASKALIWRLFFSPGTIAASGGIVAIISLLLLANQNKILVDQTNLMKLNNKALREQIVSEKIANDEMLLQSYHEDMYNQQRVALRYISNVKFLNFEDTTFSVPLNGFNLSHCNFSNKHKELKYADFSNSNLEGTTFDGSNLTRCKFNNSKFSHYDNLSQNGASFVNCNLTSTQFTSQFLAGINFSYSNFKDFIINDKDEYGQPIIGSGFKDAVLIGAKNISDDLKDRLLSEGAIFDIDALWKRKVELSNEEYIEASYGNNDIYVMMNSDDKTYNYRKYRSEMIQLSYRLEQVHSDIKSKQK